MAIKLAMFRVESPKRFLTNANALEISHLEKSRANWETSPVSVPAVPVPVEPDSRACSDPTGSIGI